MDQKTSNIVPVKILLVDDIHENLISLEALLSNEDENITYLFAKSGEEALRIAMKEELALILMDVQMPEMNGFEAAQFLRNNKKTKSIPVIFVTAVDHEISRVVHGFELGAVDFLFKPLNPVLTKAKVNAFVNFYLQKKEIEKVNEYVSKINTELEESVKERTRELMKINYDLDNFIYTASHDLKAPIINVESLLKLFYESLPEGWRSRDELIQIKEMIDASIARFKKTVFDLTDFARIQTDRTFEPERVVFSEVLNEVKLENADLLKESYAEISEDFVNAPEIFSSRKNIKNIIFNLLSNAIKYRSPLRIPQISISTVSVNSFILCTITDNGLGLKKEDFDKVFQMFKRLHTHVEGTGIGMSIVKRIVENDGGKIELESELNGGTKVKVYLKNHKPAGNLR